MPYTPASQRPTHYERDSAGAVFTSLTLPNVAGSPNTTPNLAIGDLAWDSTLGTTVECTNAAVGAATWQPAGGVGAVSLQTAYNGGNSVLLGPATEIAVDDSVAGVPTNGMEIDCSTNNGVNLSLINGPGSVQLRVEDSGTAQGINVSADYISCDQTFTVQSTGALSDLALIAGQNAILTGTGGVAVTASTAAVSVTGQTASTLQTIGAGPAYVTTANGNVNISAGGGVNGLMTLSSGNTMTLDSDTDITLQTTNGTIAIDANGAGQALLLTADDVGSLTAASIDMTSTTSNIRLTSAVDTRVNAGGLIDGVSGSTITWSAGTDCILSAGKSVRASASIDINMTPGANFGVHAIRAYANAGAEVAKINQAGDFLDPRRVRIYDPCCFQFDADYWSVNAVAAGGPPATTYVNTVPGGQMQVETFGNNAGDGANVLNNDVWLDRTGNPYFRCSFEMDTIANDDVARIGMFVNDIADTTHRAYFAHDPNVYGTNAWRCVSTAAGADETTASGVTPVAGTAEVFEILEDVRGNIYFWINGALVATHTAQLPSNGTMRLAAAGMMQGGANSTKFRVGVLDARCNLADV